MRLLLATLLAVSFAPAFAAEEPLAFKGLALGASEEDLLSRYPDAGCSDSRRSPGSRFCIVDRTIPACVRRRSAGKLLCPGDSTECEKSGKSIAECIKLEREARLTVAGVRLDWMRFSFWDGKLGEIWLRINSSPSTAPVDLEFHQISTAYLDVYGKPTKDIPSRIVTRAGVPHENRELTWERPDGRLQLTKYAGAINVSSIIFLSPDAIRVLQQDAGEQRKKAASDL